MTLSKQEAVALTGKILAMVVPDETPEEAAAAEAEAREINRLCDAADNMTAAERQALENRLRRQAGRIGLRLETLPEGDAQRHGAYRYRLFNAHTQEYLASRSDRGLHLGEVDFLVDYYTP